MFFFVPHRLRIPCGVRKVWLWLRLYRSGLHVVHLPIFRVNGRLSPARTAFLCELTTAAARAVSVFFVFTRSADVFAMTRSAVFPVALTPVDAGPVMPPEWPPAVACGQYVVPRGVYCPSARFCVAKERVDALSFRYSNACTTQIQLLCFVCGLPYSSESTVGIGGCWFHCERVSYFSPGCGGCSYFHDDPRIPYGGVLWVHVAPVDVVLTDVLSGVFTSSRAKC